ncbi:MAG: ribonuclease III [Syntrophomonadaceae bacterium]|nr:ribonuclease III [Syntrophomonadaceae bacterium]
MDEQYKCELQILLKSWDLERLDLELLEQALTHPSYAFENQAQKVQHNQRLEFLGDAVLGMVAAEYLYRIFPSRSEGDLTRIRASAVCEATLAEIAQQMNLGPYLRLGRGEEMSGGRKKSSILADALEAVIGAVYLSGGWEAASQLVLRYLKDILNSAPNGYLVDYKTALQETVQRHKSEGVTYRILREFGPDHNKRFVAGVFYRGKILGQGQGRTKKEAEQQAARSAMQKDRGNGFRP